MKTKHTTIYECEICHYTFGSIDDALVCESKPVTGDKGVKVGDKVRVFRGDGAGDDYAKVKKVFVFEKNWGHYLWERYWHTVGLVVDFVDGGSRTLTFDDYDTV